MGVSRERHAQKRAQQSNLASSGETNSYSLIRTGAAIEAYELALGFGVAVLGGGAYKGAIAVGGTALEGFAACALAVLLAVGVCWSIGQRIRLKRAGTTISTEAPAFSGRNQSAIVATEDRSNFRSPFLLAWGTMIGGFLGAAAGAFIAILVDSPDVARGAVRIAPACAVLGFLGCLAALQLRRSAP